MAFSKYNRARHRIAELLSERYGLPDRIIQELIDIGRTDRALLSQKGWGAAWEGTAHNLNVLCDDIEHSDYYNPDS